MGRNKQILGTMAFSGNIILAFIVLAYIYFQRRNSVDNQTENTLYDLVLLRFADFWYSALYVIAMLFLGLHLNHALRSALHTLGLISQTNKNISLAIDKGFALFLQEPKQHKSAKQVD